MPKRKKKKTTMTMRLVSTWFTNNKQKKMKKTLEVTWSNLREIMKLHGQRLAEQTSNTMQV